MTTPKRALILIDVQQEYFDGPLQIQYPAVNDALANITTAIDNANEAGIPVAVIQHVMGEGAPVFDPTKPSYELHPEIERRRTPEWKHIVKSYASVFAGTNLLPWLQENNVDTVTFTGFMTNNCVLGSAVGAEEIGLSVEVLSDATGAISIANSAGTASAETVHNTLMAVLNSNWAAVASTADWADALKSGTGLDGSNLIVSALEGRANS